MARPPSAITTSGGLLPAELLARLAQSPESLPGTTPADYHLAVGRRLRDAINRSWSELTGAWAGFDGLAPSERTTAQTRERWLLPLMAELGFGRLPRLAGGITVDQTAYPISHAWGAVPIHLLGAEVSLDRRTKGMAGAATASPHALMQELLNRSDEHLWGILANGRQLRLLRDHTSLTRPAYVEFDLVAIFGGQSFADFAVLWMLCHESRFESERPEECWLERWAADARARGVRALDALSEGFEKAITALGSGFLAHPANAELRARLRDGSLRAADYQRQLLRLVYRLVLLLAAEDRGLLHPPGADPVARSRYGAHYSLGRLREAARRRASTRHGDLWESLRPVFAGLGLGGIGPLALPVLGSFLWSAGACPDLDVARLANADLLGAVRALAFTERDKVAQRVDFANLGPEELGSIYESLLELRPEINTENAAFELVVVPGHERKTTGSYYTHTSLVVELLDSALEPVLDDAAHQRDPEGALLAVKVLDPACGSGHFLIAAAQRIARRLAAVREQEAAPSPETVRHALRDVIGHCVYGIDVNPMALELAKVNLWLEAMEPGRPLSFLDHHLACGNALLGTPPELVARPIPDDAYKALTGDDKAVAARWRKTNAAEARQVTTAGQGLLALTAPGEDLLADLARHAVALDAMPDDTPEAVEAKAAAHATLTASAGMARARLAADAWCAAFLLPKRAGAPMVTSRTVAALMEGHASDVGVVQAVEDVRARAGILHWHLAFPQVFAGDGGFAVVLGNPPWEKVKLAEKEFFAARHPGVAGAAGAKRKTLIAGLEAEEPGLWDEYREALHQAEAESLFLRTSGRYPLCGRGDVNTFAVFAEAMRDALAPNGRLGVVVPTGIATDYTTEAFFADCVASRRLASLFDFENREKLFPDVDSRMKFCLLTLTGPSGNAEEASFAFFAHRTAELADPERRFTLTPEDLVLLNPNTRTAPVFRTWRDAELTKAIYRRVPVLMRDGDPDGNPWGIEFSTMFHMTNDSQLFRTAAELAAEGAKLDGNAWRKGSDAWLPLYEAKMAHQFTHRWGDYAMQPAGSADTQLPDIPIDRLADPTYLVQPRFWVAEPEVHARLKRSDSWLLGFRDVTNATNERTMIATALPLAAVGNNEPLLVLAAPSRLACLLPAILNSFVFDYCARRKVGGTHINFFIAKQFPVISPDSLGQPAPWSPAHTVAEWMAPRVLELTYTAVDMAGFAADLGYDGPPFRWEPERRRELRAELDAACFHLYGLDRDELDYVMGTFPIVRRKDEATHGEYLTKRLILDRFDTIATAIGSQEPYLGALDPPPADPRVTHSITGR